MALASILYFFRIDLWKPMTQQKGMSFGELVAFWSVTGIIGLPMDRYIFGSLRHCVIDFFFKVYDVRLPGQSPGRSTVEQSQGGGV